MKFRPLPKNSQVGLHMSYYKMYLEMLYARPKFLSAPSPSPPQKKFLTPPLGDTDVKFSLNSVYYLLLSIIYLFDYMIHLHFCHDETPQLGLTVILIVTFD